MMAEAKRVHYILRDWSGKDLGKWLICREGVDPPPTKQDTKWVADPSPTLTKLGNNAQRKFDEQGWVIGDR